MFGLNYVGEGLETRMQWPAHARKVRLDLEHCRIARPNPHDPFLAY